MQFLIWVFGFLIFFSCLAYVRFNDFVQTRGGFSNLLAKQKAEREVESKAQQLYFEIITEPRKEEPSELKVKPGKHKTAKSNEAHLYLELPPHNARLNIAKVFREGDEKLPYTQLFLHLLDILYLEQPFYQEIPNCSKELLKAILARATINNESGKQKLTSPQDLATLFLDDRRMQEVLFHVLKGSRGNYPSLLDYITLEPTRKKYEIHIHLAPLKLLEAVFNHEQVAQAIVQRRELLHEMGQRRLSSKKNSLVTSCFLTKEEVASILHSYKMNLSDYEKLLDFDVTRPTKQSLSPFLAISCEDKQHKCTAKKKLPH